MHLSYNKFAPSVPASAFVAPTAVVVGRVSLGEQSSIWFGAVLRGDINSIEIMDESNIQDGCLLHVTDQHPLIVEQRVTVGHGAILHGCHVQSNCLIGMGAIVLDGAVIGSGSIIAAGAVVAPGTQIPANSLVMGIPARVVRTAGEQDQKSIEHGWQSYVRLASTYQAVKPRH